MTNPAPPPTESTLQSIASLCGTLVTGLFILTFIFQNFAIPSASMASTLLVGDHVIADRASLAPASSGPRLIPYRPLRRNEPVVFFRREDGIPVALEDRCCHRRAPLSLGKLHGDIVECPYHGLRFDQTGACVRIPSQDRIPAAARVTAYPVVERNRWIWIWMGDPALADPDLIEDFHWIEDPDWGFGGDRLHLEGNYLLLVDNLLDTTHLTFIHPTTLGTNDFVGSEVETDGRTLVVTKVGPSPLPHDKRLCAYLGS